MAPDGPGDDSLHEFLAPGDVVAEKYRIERLIGSGGMGVVVQAYHLKFEERVAIKFLLPQMGANREALLRFEQEAKAAYKIKSEHVTRVIDVGKLDDVPYMVMEYLEGTDLADLLHQRRKLSAEDTVEYILQACEAVAEAHTLGIVHRDLKPENLFLTNRADGSCCIKVLDFGLSKIRPAAGETRERALTAASQPMGTPQYMSPEQWMSSSDVGPATDIWALGVLLYELLTGVQPFKKEQLAQLCSMVLHTEPASMRAYLPALPQELEAVVMRCLRKRPDQRYQNVAELAISLEAFAPERLSATIRRITGIFRRAGVPVSAPSSAPRPSSPRAEVKSAAEPGGTPAPGSSQPRQRYDSDTQVIPDDHTLEREPPTERPGLADDVGGWPSDAGTSPLGTALQPGIDQPGRQAEQSVRKAPEDPLMRTQVMLDSGEEHVDVMLESGEHPVPPPPYVRSVTAQSWLNTLDGERTRRKSRRVAIAVVAGGSVLLGVVLVAIFVGTSAPEPSSATDASSEQGQAASDSVGTETTPREEPPMVSQQAPMVSQQGSEPESDSSASSPAASTSGTAAARAGAPEPGAAPFRRPVPTAKRSTPMPRPASKPRPKSRTDLFKDR